MEKGPEENNKVPKKVYGCILTVGATVFGLLSINHILHEKYKNEYIDFIMLYGIPGVYGTRLIAMFIYSSFIKNK